MPKWSSVHPEQHQLTVRRADGVEITYDPSRLKGVDTYKPVTIQLAIGERVQFTAPMKDLRIANREQGTVEALSPEGRASIHLDSGRKVSLDPDQMRHLDHGYAVTSHSSQGLTADRVLVHVDTGVHPELVSDRFRLCIDIEGFAGRHPLHQQRGAPGRTRLQIAREEFGARNHAENWRQASVNQSFGIRARFGGLSIGRPRRTLAMLIHLLRVCQQKDDGLFFRYSKINERIPCQRPIRPPD